MTESKMARFAFFATFLAFLAILAGSDSSAEWRALAILFALGMIGAWKFAKWYGLV